MEIAWAVTNETLRVGVNIGVWEALWNAGPIVKFTLVLLLFLSVWSWAIIFSKWKQFKSAKNTDEDFLALFWSSKSLDEANAQIKSYESSPIAQVFKAGFAELQRIAKAAKAEQPDSQNKLTGLDNVSRALRKAEDIEISFFEKQLSVLATTASISPFIGLFGTVWGIMTAFQRIGSTGVASLAVVAPGISEALIATAIGLGAAIPAVAFYNVYIGYLKKQELEISNFVSDFLNIVKRNFFKES